MPQRTPRPATALVGLVLVSVLVAASAALAYRLVGDDGNGDSARRAGRSTAPTTTASTAAPSTEPGATTVPPASNLSPEQARTVEELKAQVSEIRGLDWKGDLPVRIVSSDELARRLAELNDVERNRYPGEEEAVEAVLKLLQLIPSDLDYTSAIDKLLAGGVLGFYDDEAKELYVGGDPDADLDLATRSTMVHELNHALTDQQFDFGTRNRALSDQHLGEESYALAALVEGDAELVRTLWAQEYLTGRQRAEAELGGSSGDPSVYFATPEYILGALFFPYQSGLEFVSALHDKGGFGAVDAAYRQPPTSTEEILHPDLFVPGRTWARPSLPDLAAVTGCTRVDVSTIGEFDMTALLDLQLPEAEARRAAAGWNGDAYGLVRCGTTMGLADRWRADTPADLTELADSLARWAEGWSGSDRPPDGEGRFSGPSGAGRIIRTADRVDLVIAGDASTSDRLASAVLAA